MLKLKIQAISLTHLLIAIGVIGMVMLAGMAWLQIADPLSPEQTDMLQKLSTLQSGDTLVFKEPPDTALVQYVEGDTMRVAFRSDPFKSRTLDIRTLAKDYRNISYIRLPLEDMPPPEMGMTVP